MAKLPRHGTIGKNHISSRSSSYRICFFICSKYDTFLKDYSTRLILLSCPLFPNLFFTCVNNCNGFFIVISCYSNIYPIRRLFFNSNRHHIRHPEFIWSFQNHMIIRTALYFRENAFLMLRKIIKAAIRDQCNHSTCSVGIWTTAEPDMKHNCGNQKDR